MKSGQILILVLLIVVVALAVGLSVASRNITNLRTATQTDQSQRAFTAAEGGVESVLSDLGSYAANPNITSGVSAGVPVGDLTANVNVKGYDYFESTVDLGNVAQVDLDGDSGSIQVDWAKGSAENAGPDGPASVEIAPPAVFRIPLRSSFNVSKRTSETWRGELILNSLPASLWISRSSDESDFFVF